ncbi:GAF domain-containing sensor histidine kinase [Falsibacillus albus]|uniref:histidine kinase n=1 Tax=Falsibacillus albus TaxID=2478915 RepID=A0A3L7K9Q7_9BACI|nr:GAF domain-containing sensor histidine kinase [Falsibacillus albus]RLQ97372.1 GAF domain-containing protein [Falsibacillus albus]
MSLEEIKHQSDLHILKSIAELLNEETDLAPMLKGVLKKLLQITGFTTGWIFFIDGEQGAHSMVAAENLPAALTYCQCQPMKKGSCWCVDKLQKGKLTKASNIIECKRIEDAIEHEWGETEGITHHATVPLQSGKETFGLLNVASPHKKQFTSNELALLESVALQIGSAIKRMKLTKKEQEVALMQERNRLARDLHDSVNQLLFSLTLTARGGASLTEDPDIKDTFSMIGELAQEALTEMRALIWQLRPKGLEVGLLEAIKGYGEMLGLKVHTKLTGVMCLPSKIEEALWRICQEALNNCKKHSGQNEVFIQMKVSEKSFEMNIEDKGCGFDFEKGRTLYSVGLQSMKERTEALSGTFRFESKLGSGTKITVTMPY